MVQYKVMPSKKSGWQMLFVLLGCVVVLGALVSVWHNLFNDPNKQHAMEPFFSANTTQISSKEPLETFVLQKPLYNLSEPYWLMTSNSTCSLHHMGQLLNDDKFTSHQYMNIYCDVFRDFKSSQKKTRMLEIGFGCGHNNHGVSARIWKSFFTDGGSGLDLYEIDLDTPQHRNCSTKFLSEHRNIVNALYLGDQSNQSFLRQVATESGGSYDIMLDDGGHGDWHQRPTFAVMWDHVMPGTNHVTITAHQIGH